MEAATTPLADVTADTETDVSTDAESSFNLELNSDQKDIREWVHGFAEGVVRSRVGRARGDPVARHPGGREHRAVLLRGARAVLR